MEKKNKFIFLFIGIVIGVVIALTSTYLFDIGIAGGSHKENHEMNESGHDHENEADVEDEHGEEPHGDEESINISDEVMKEFGIELQIAGGGNIAVHKDLTGEIVPNTYNVAHIVPRFAGIVKEVYQRIGDNIKKGDKIATIESNESLVTYDVISSIDGTILELHMTPGELIGDDKHIVMVANLNNVWAELSIYQQDLGKIKVGQNVEITSPHSETVFKGKLFYISPIVDEATRTAFARVKLNNTKGIWKPGMFISGSVLTNYKKVKIAVPVNAIQILDGERVIFINDNGGFRPQVVTLGLENNNLIEVIDGLHVGEEYVSKGAYTFKSEILKESFGGGHAH
ncbi:MAG: efflux RND transporter periplasmic adaptor subunit [Melioribacteraceae bacterium]|nr:efflux RND transporter periplasmic adaptor subunit [Melioribacteraceae bacterium]